MTETTEILQMAREHGALRSRVDEHDKDIEDHEDRLEDAERRLDDWDKTSRQIRRDIWFGVVMVLVGIMISNPHAYATVALILKSAWNAWQLYQQGGTP